MVGEPSIVIRNGVLPTSKARHSRGRVAVGVVLTFLLMFKPRLAPFVAPVYAVAEGVFLGVVSWGYENAYDGLVVQAAGATVAVFGVMLVSYRTRVIKVTERFRTIVVAATLGVMVFYGVSLLIRLFAGADSIRFLSSPSPLGIVFSVLVAGLAAFNLALDFDFIERGAEQRLDKRFEWFAAFGLLVTIVWLYLELLRLLSKLRSRGAPGRGPRHAGPRPHRCVPLARHDRKGRKPRRPTRGSWCSASPSSTTTSASPCWSWPIGRRSWVGPRWPSSTTTCGVTTSWRALGGFDAVVLMRADPRARRGARAPAPAAVDRHERPRLALDLDAADRLDITVCGTRVAEAITSTIEHAWALILGLARTLATEDAAIRTGGWMVGLGPLLHGKTLGLVGIGNIGSLMPPVACGRSACGSRRGAEPHRRPRGRGRCRAARPRRVLRHRRRGERAPQIVGTVTALRRCRAVRGDEAGPLFVNTSRGAVVDTDALLAALRSEGARCGARRVRRGAAPPRPPAAQRTQHLAVAARRVRERRVLSRVLHADRRGHRRLAAGCAPLRGPVILVHHGGGCDGQDRARRGGGRGPPDDGPESVIGVPHKVHPIEAAHDASVYYMAAIVLKSHDFPSCSVADLVGLAAPDVVVRGSVCCDFCIGGLNPAAVEIRAARRRGRSCGCPPSRAGRTS